MRVYISGGITDVDNYLDNFDRAEKRLRKLGWSVVNPARVMDALPKDTPRQCYMDLSLKMLKYCDAIYMLRNWQYSEGANEERDHAQIQNKDILYEAEMERDCTYDEEEFW